MACAPDKPRRRRSDRLAEGCYFAYRVIGAGAVLSMFVLALWR